VKMENSSACATMNWKVYLSVIKRTCNQGANNSNHLNWDVTFVTYATLHVTI
jgi:hypothetical protein